MANAIETAEQMGKGRAAACLVIAAVILLLLMASFGPAGSDFVRGLWMGVTIASTLSLLPLGRWVKPGSMVARLLDDESTREHRRLASTVGLIAAVASAVAMSFITADDSPVSAFDTARVIATAAMVASLVSFATLELRAARG